MSGRGSEPIVEELPAEVPSRSRGSPPTARPSSCCRRPAARPDDLAKLTGVGPQLEKKLNEGGIWHYWQVAAMTPDDIAKVDAELKLNGRIARDGWVELARPSSPAPDAIWLPRAAAVLT